MSKVAANRAHLAGFSLLEVLITLVVLGTGLISLARFQGAVLQENDGTKARSVALQLAEERIEQFRENCT